MTYVDRSDQCEKQVNMPSTFAEHAKINRMVTFLESLRSQV